MVLQSDFLNLGALAGDGRPKVISALEWDADTPPGTRVLLRSRTGNGLNETYTFHDRAGNEVSETRWNSSPVVLRGRVDTTIVVGDDWGPWSGLYQASGESFQSDSPRRFLQLELLLTTEDPQLAPVLRNLTVRFEEALVQGALGGISPRAVAPNVETRFRYTVWPRFETGDIGFDLLRFRAPEELSDIEVRVGGEEVVGFETQVDGDSLLIALPARVREDSVEVLFNARIVQNATVFALELGDRALPGLWQSVEPAGRRSDVVLLPDLAARNRLVGDLRLSSPVFSPNGDGVNDRLEIEFVILKLQGGSPKIRLFDLSGRERVVLQGEAASRQQRLVWDGLDAEGVLLPPGIYLFQIDLGAESGRDTVWRSAVVAY